MTSIRSRSFVTQHCFSHMFVNYYNDYNWFLTDLLFGYCIADHYHLVHDRFFGPVAACRDAMDKCWRDQGLTSQSWQDFWYNRASNVVSKFAEKQENSTNQFCRFVISLNKSLFNVWKIPKKHLMDNPSFSNLKLGIVSSNFLKISLKNFEQSK